MRVGSLLCVSDVFRNKRAGEKRARLIPPARSWPCFIHVTLSSTCSGSCQCASLRNTEVAFSDCGRRSHLRTAGPLNSFALARNWRLLAVAIRSLL